MALPPDVVVPFEQFVRLRDEDVGGDARVARREWLNSFTNPYTPREWEQGLFVILDNTDPETSLNFLSENVFEDVFLVLANELTVAGPDDVGSMCGRTLIDRDGNEDWSIYPIRMADRS